jgi:hypothetical protein
MVSFLPRRVLANALLAMVNINLLLLLNLVVFFGGFHSSSHVSSPFQCIARVRLMRTETHLILEHYALSRPRGLFGAE